MSAEKSTGKLAVFVRSGELNRWLDQAVESVLASDYALLEVIVLLNGPSIGVSVDAVAAQEAAHPWMQDARVSTYRYDRYLGMSGSMIEATSKISGDVEFMANVDGDDYVAPEKFSAQISYLQAHPDCVLVGTGAYMIDGEGAVTGELGGTHRDDVRSKLYLFNPLPHSSVLYRRSAFEKVGGHTPGLSQCEDYDFTLRIACHGKVAQLAQKYVYYRVHQSNLSKGATASGPHMKCVSEGRRALAHATGTPSVVACPQHLLWVAIQYIRTRGLIRPLHEYRIRKSS
ncbi:glycosyltransferase family A protein [Rothia sp. ZJ1223]|uniref:glycosyltransferase family 2 protein n=1 Tax=Rothia sp. ZJ1223 TaxID=2811098 RepID=UPI00195D3D05|nr:glycosyltransferase family A protein [Rothia sp. ZJ1223]MBM7051756.1 glycosyltransferase family 2 protein [Rothia sp. ZJ1223]